MLFTTPYACVLGPPRPHFRFRAVPLMRVNHQVHEETKAVLYQENNFVRLKLDSSDVAMRVRSFCNPLLGPGENEVRASLTIDLQYIQAFHGVVEENSELPNDEDEGGRSVIRYYKYLIGLETLDHFVQGLWETATENGMDFGSSRRGLQHLALTLNFNDSIFGCREKVQHALLKSLSKLHSLGGVVVTGAIGHQQGQQLLEHMDAIPSAAFVQTTFDDYTAEAETAYEAARLSEALQHWKSAVRYVEFVRDIARSHEMEFDNPLPLVQLLRKLNIEINMLRIRMAGSCLRRYDPCAAYQWIDENNGTWYGRSLHVVGLTCVAEAYAKLMMQEYDSDVRSSGPAGDGGPQTLDNTAFLYFVLDHYDHPRYGHPDDKKLFLRLCRVWGPIFSSPYILDD